MSKIWCNTATETALRESICHTWFPEPTADANFAGFRFHDFDAGAIKSGTRGYTFCQKQGRRCEMQTPKRGGDDQRIERLIRKLESYPEVLDRVERIMEVGENDTGEAITADEAEELLVQELRRMGHDALQGWARRKEVKLEGDYSARSGMVRREKKDSTGRPDSDR